MPSLQLTDAQEPLWSAAAWVGITRDASGQWGDASGPLYDLPWCPNEPDNNFKDGTEACANLLTGCANTGQALLNDFACDKVARVVCALPGALDCGEWPVHSQSCSTWPCRCQGTPIMYAATLVSPEAPQQG